MQIFVSYLDHILFPHEYVKFLMEDAGLGREASTEAVEISYAISL